MSIGQKEWKPRVLIFFHEHIDNNIRTKSHNKQSTNYEQIRLDITLW